MELPNFIETFEGSIKKNWDLPALSNYKGETLKYGEVGEQIIKLHLMFGNCVKPDDKIVLVGRNSINWAVTYLSAITYGGTVVPILPDFHPKDMENIINHSDAKVLFAGEQMLAKIDLDKLENIKAVIKLDDFTVVKEGEGRRFECANQAVDELFKEKYGDKLSVEDLTFKPLDNKHIGVISYTSGTTGFSKGVMLPLASLMGNIEFAWNNMPLKAEENILSILPLAHSYGCAFEFLWPFTIGVHITFLGKMMSPQIMLEAFKEVRPSLLLMVPLIMEKIYKRKLQPVLSKKSTRILLRIPLVNKLIYNKIHAGLTESFGGNFREVVIGGAALNKDVERFLRKIKFNFSVGYGMTECGPLISYANWDKAKTGSCGSLVDRLEMMIDSPDPENIAGEIMVRGTHVMTGYYKNDEATNNTLDKDGWLHTGDLGVMDKNNFVFIRGRSKSLILGPSGENIYPEEIEAKLSNLPYVHEQVVVEKDKKLVALVFPDFEGAKNNGVDKEALNLIMEDNRKILNENLPKYAQVTKIQVQEKEFEKTPKQSIKRFLYS